MLNQSNWEDSDAPPSEIKLVGLACAARLKAQNKAASAAKGKAIVGGGAKFHSDPPLNPPAAMTTVNKPPVGSVPTNMPPTSTTTPPSLVPGGCTAVGSQEPREATPLRAKAIWKGKFGRKRTAPRRNNPTTLESYTKALKELDMDTEDHPQPTPEGKLLMSQQKLHKIADEFATCGPRWGGPLAADADVDYLESEPGAVHSPATTSGGSSPDGGAGANAAPTEGDNVHSTFPTASR